MRMKCLNKVNDFFFIFFCKHDQHGGMIKSKGWFASLKIQLLPYPNTDSVFAPKNVFSLKLLYWYLHMQRKWSFIKFATDLLSQILLILIKIFKTIVKGLTLFSVSVSETRWNACKECGNSRGAMGSHAPSFGALILMRICQLDLYKEHQQLNNKDLHNYFTKLLYRQY